MSKKKSMKGKGTYAVYNAESRREKNRAKRLEKHLKKHPGDKQTLKYFGAAVSAKRVSESKTGQKQARVTLHDGAGRPVSLPDFEPYSK
jgi:hypothetical protein